MFFSHPALQSVDRGPSLSFGRAIVLSRCSFRSKEPRCQWAKLRKNMLQKCHFLFKKCEILTKGTFWSLVFRRKNICSLEFCLLLGRIARKKVVSLHVCKLFFFVCLYEEYLLIYNMYYSRRVSEYCLVCVGRKEENICEYGGFSSLLSKSYTR